MNYQVIIVLDEAKGKSYYHSYVVSENTTLGNITCTELPPYADVNKAQSCYWDTKAKAWVYDEEKYTELVEEQEAVRTAEEQAKKENAAVPSNKVLAKAVMDLANEIADIEEKLKSM